MGSSSCTVFQALACVLLASVVAVQAFENQHSSSSRGWAAARDAEAKKRLEYAFQLSQARASDVTPGPDASEQDVNKPIESAQAAPGPTATAITSNVTAVEVNASKGCTSNLTSATIEKAGASATSAGRLWTASTTCLVALILTACLCCYKPSQGTFSRRLKTSTAMELEKVPLPGHTDMQPVQLNVAQPAESPSPSPRKGTSGHVTVSNAETSLPSTTPASSSKLEHSPSPHAEPCGEEHGVETAESPQAVVHIAHGSIPIQQQLRVQGSVSSTDAATSSCSIQHHDECPQQPFAKLAFAAAAVFDTCGVIERRKKRKKRSNSGSSGGNSWVDLSRTLPDTCSVPPNSQHSTTTSHQSQQQSNALPTQSHSNQTYASITSSGISNSDNRALQAPPSADTHHHPHGVSPVSNLVKACTGPDSSCVPPDTLKEASLYQLDPHANHDDPHSATSSQSTETEGHHCHASPSPAPPQPQACALLSSGASGGSSCSSSSSHPSQTVQSPPNSPSPGLMPTSQSTHSEQTRGHGLGHGVSTGEQELVQLVSSMSNILSSGIDPPGSPKMQALSIIHPHSDLIPSSNPLHGSNNIIIVISKESVQQLALYMRSSAEEMCVAICRPLNQLAVASKSLVEGQAALNRGVTTLVTNVEVVVDVVKHTLFRAELQDQKLQCSRAVQLGLCLVTLSMVVCAVKFGRVAEVARVCSSHNAFAKPPWDTTSGPGDMSHSFSTSTAGWPSGTGLGFGAGLLSAPTRMWHSLPSLTGLSQKWMTQRLLDGSLGPGSGAKIVGWWASACCWIRELRLVTGGVFAIYWLLRVSLSCSASCSMHHTWMLDVPLGLACFGGAAGWLVAGCLGASPLAWIVLWELWCGLVCLMYVYLLPMWWQLLHLFVIGVALPLAVGYLPFLTGAKLLQLVMGM